MLYEYRKVCFGQGIAHTRVMIGPTEFLQPGESASFTEDWWLFQYDYPKDKKADLGALTEFVRKNTQ